MTVRYAVDLEQVAAHVVRARQYAEEVEATVARLDRVVADLHLTWEGRAADAHARAHGEWVRGMRELRDALGRLGDVAGRAHDGYSSAASTNHEMWRVLA